MSDFNIDYVDESLEDNIKDDAISDNIFSKAKILFSLDGISVEEKKVLLKLLGYYKKINKISSNLDSKNISLIEKSIYENNGIYNDVEKVSFELERIKLNIFNKVNVSAEILEEYKMILRVMELYISNQLEKKDVVLRELLESIVLIELKLGMKIGLYSILCDLFEKKYNYYNNKIDENIEVNNIRRK